MNIEDCKDLAEYLLMCHVRSIDDLTKDQILAWARSGKMGLSTQVSVDIVEHGLFGEMPDMDKAIRLLKQAMKEQKEFFCAYVENESCDGPGETDYETFEMGVR